MIEATKLAGFTQMALQPAVNKGRFTRQERPAFAAAFRTYQRSVTRTGRPSAENLPQVPQTPTNPGPGSIIVSPFNPMGYAISATPAPTAAEVEADPERWRGTSFDPALRIVPNRNE
jgi:hypothetical protein